MQSLIDVCREIVKMDQAIEEVERTLEGMKENRELMRAVAADRFVQEGVQNIKDSDGRVYYLRRDIYVNKVGGVDGDEVTCALREMGLTEFIREGYDGAKLKAWIRERDESNEAPTPIEESIPARLRGLIKATEITRVMHRGGKSSE